jgi:ATP-binding cassette, subfamily B, bacterial
MRLRRMPPGGYVAFLWRIVVTVRMADAIYVFRGTRVVERGNHLELMSLRGVYAELFNMQAEAFR